MNKSDARKIAEEITNEEILDMFNNAKENITDWTKISVINKGMSIGTSWNILASDFNVNTEYHIMAKTNMIREFGEFLPKKFINKPTKTYVLKNIVHQHPKF